MFKGLSLKQLKKILKVRTRLLSNSQLQRRDNKITNIPYDKLQRTDKKINSILYD